MDEKTLLVTSANEGMLSSLGSFICDNKTSTLICICLIFGGIASFKYGDSIAKYGSEFFRGRSFKANKDGSLEAKPEHTTTLKTGDNEAKKGSIDNFAVGTNPSLETGKNVAEKDVNNTAFDKDTPQNTMDFLSERKNSMK